MNILVFALCVCIRLRENKRKSVWIQAKNHITLYGISSSGHKGIAGKKYEMCTCYLSSSTLPCSRKWGFSWTCFNLFCRSQSVPTYSIFSFPLRRGLWLGNFHRSLPLSAVLCQYGTANRRTGLTCCMEKYVLFLNFNHCCCQLYPTSSVEKKNEKMILSQAFLIFVGHCHIALCLFLSKVKVSCFPSPSSFRSHHKLLVILVALFQGFLITIFPLLGQQNKKCTQYPGYGPLCYL